MPLPSTMTPIATQTLNANAASLTFSSIPQGYTDIIIITSGLSQPAGGGAAFLRFNGDTSSNYSYRYMFGNGSSTSSGGFSNTTGVPTNRHNTTEGGGKAHIMSYSNSSIYKSVISTGAGNNISIAYSSMWRNTSPITSITIFPESGPGWAAGFTATLYGIKAAS